MECQFRYHLSHLNVAQNYFGCIASIASRVFVCSGTVPQRCEFGSKGPTSTEQLEKLAVDEERCTNVGFVNSFMFTGPWIACKDESRFNLWDHDGRIRVRRYAGEFCLPECVIERHSGLIPGVMVWDAISYHGRSNFLRTESNFNSNKYGREVLQPEVVPFLEGIPGAIFHQDNARAHVAKIVRDFCSAQHMQLFP
ncbi:transposable element Tc1 transposase [Trichonephila clavipes]|nr:transposable element Tc1 transposase [Trichonephila clavipes]